MALIDGDFTTPGRVAIWMSNPPTLPSPLISQLIKSMTALIYNKLNRARMFSQTFTRTIDGTGTYQLILPDWPVTAITSVQMESALILASPLPNPVTGVIPPPSYGYGYRFVPWSGNLPGEPAVLEFVNGCWYYGAQNIKITYTAGYYIASEPQTVPVGGGQVTVQQAAGLWCRDGGVTYSSTGVALTAVAANPIVGQYVAPVDSNPGLYTFSAADQNTPVLISYSFVPVELEEACIQMVAERYSYRSRIGEVSRSLGGQESTRYLRGDGDRRRGFMLDIPPEVEGLIWPYASVIPPAFGAPV